MLTFFISPKTTLLTDIVVLDKNMQGDEAFLKRHQGQYRFKDNFDCGGAVG